MLTSASRLFSIAVPRSAVSSSRSAALATCFCLLTPWAFGSAALASDLTGFLPAAGEGVVALSLTDESYDDFWVGDQKVSEPARGEISTESASLWLSWGLTDRLALIANVAYVDTEASGPAGLEDSGPQDASLMLAGRVWQSNSDFNRGSKSHSLTLAAGIRTAIESYEANAPVARGDETTDGLLRLVYLFRSGRFYWSQQVGFDLRGGEAPDSFPFYTELGWSTARVTWVASYSRLLADGGTDIGEPGFTFPSNREEYSRLGAKVIAAVSPRWAVFGGGFTTLDGRNAGNAEGFTLGVIRKF